MSKASLQETTFSKLWRTILQSNEKRAKIQQSKTSIIATKVVLKVMRKQLSEKHSLQSDIFFQALAPMFWFTYKHPKRWQSAKNLPSEQKKSFLCVISMSLQQPKLCLSPPRRPQIILAVMNWCLIEHKDKNYRNNRLRDSWGKIAGHVEFCCDSYYYFEEKSFSYATFLKIPISTTPPVRENSVMW